MGIAANLLESARAATASLTNAELLFYGAATLCIAVLAAVLMSPRAKPFLLKTAANTPPMVPYTIPFVGSAIEYGIDPVKFIIDNMEKYGDCFSFMMLGRTHTFCLGPDGNHFVFNVPLANASAEDVYRTLTVPVFGDEVVYDVHNSVFMEQKKFVKDTFTTSAFRTYVPMIREETLAFLKDWKASETRNIFEDMSELTIRTASRCLMGKEVRQQLHSNVAQLYHDLDAGLAPINVFFRWLPLLTFIRRDRANRIMTDLFTRILNERRARGDFQNSDLMQTLMESQYRDGSKMSDNAIAHLMIATLMGGQHTSSTTSSWILFELARRPDVVDALLKEQSMVLTGKPDTPAKDLPEFDYDQLREMTTLDCVMKETLRLHPPIHTIMRKVNKDINFKGYTIPAGNVLCGSGAVSQLDPIRFPEPRKFEPSRFINNDEGAGEWTINGVDIAQKSARSHFLPFGAGRHRCIGEAFAYTQIKTIIALFVREFRHKLPLDANNNEVFPKMDYTSLIVVPQKPALLQVERRS